MGRANVDLCAIDGYALARPLNTDQVLTESLILPLPFSGGRRWRFASNADARLVHMLFDERE